MCCVWQGGSWGGGGGAVEEEEEEEEEEERAAVKGKMQIDDFWQILVDSG